MVSVTRSLVSSLCCAALLALGCNSAHTNDSTETGNPPFLDVDKIALVISSGEARIVGQPGAVTPGGASVELENVASGEVTRGTANADGSFDIAIDATQDAVIEVRASEGSRESASVFVTRGGAMVGTGEGDALSCMQRSNFASQALGSILSSADTSCQTTADCKHVPYRTVCTDTCSDAVVNASEEQRIRGGVEAIDEGLCSTFAADGCQVIALPCVPPPTGPLACVAGRCTQGDEQAMMPQPTEVACPSCVESGVRWRQGNRLVEYSVSDCDTFTRMPMGEMACSSQLPHCNSGRPGPTVEELLTALSNSEVQAALADGGRVGSPPIPGGFDLTVQVGDRSFVISGCAGTTCAPVPAGVQALKALLDRIASEIECAPSTCPPNARLVEDACTQCGLAGGCGMTEAKCAIVCSDNSQCPTDPPGLGCSSRGICEVTACL